MSQQALWFSGVCDTLLVKIQWWYDRYEKGEVRATRKFLAVDGVKDVPTKYLHQIPFSKKEAEYLVRILQAKAPKLPATEVLAVLPLKLKKYPMNTRQEYTIPLSLYKQEIESILKALKEAKADVLGHTGPMSTDTFVSNQKSTGKGLWEV